jgi:Mn-dependent DtxR family transcriptional regulator
MSARQIQQQIPEIGLGSVMTNIKRLRKRELIQTKKGYILTIKGNKLPINLYKENKR